MTTATLLLGAFVADAASLGVHWIYDPARIAEIAARQGGRTAFTPVDAANYAGEVGYFAHEARPSGGLSQYGEALRLAVQTMPDGRFDRARYQAGFAAYFGPGGAYAGYIDRPTRGALAKIAEGLEISGIDDDQLPAISRIPAIMAGYHRDTARDAALRAAMEITNVNAAAAAYGAVFADLLGQVMDDIPLDRALRDAADRADPAIARPLQAALATSETGSTEFAATTGRACHLPMAAPLIFHILRHSTGFADAVERNNRAGGDSAGRAILLGAIMGRIHGLAPDRGIPLGWVLQMRDAAAIWAISEQLAAAGSGTGGGT